MTVNPVYTQAHTPVFIVMDWVMNLWGIWQSIYTYLKEDLSGVNRTAIFEPGSAGSWNATNHTLEAHQVV